MRACGRLGSNFQHLLVASFLTISLLLSILHPLGAQDMDTVMTITKDTDTTVKASDFQKKACIGKTHLRVEEMPSFPGGKEKMRSFLKDSLVVPQEAKEKGIEGSVHVGFTVCKDGTLKDIKVMKGLGHGCDRAAIRAVRSMPPWKPGKKEGEKAIVRTDIEVPIAP